MMWLATIEGSDDYYEVIEIIPPKMDDPNQENIYVLDEFGEVCQSEITGYWPEGRAA